MVDPYRLRAILNAQPKSMFPACQSAPENVAGTMVAGGRFTVLIPDQETRNGRRSRSQD